MKVVNSNKKWFSYQLLIALYVLLGVQSRLQAAMNSTPTQYRAEQCDCLGFTNDIPTFLSDLTQQAPSIMGEGQTAQEAAEQARQMCIDNYRGFASAAAPQSVTESGCHFYKLTKNGDWESI